VPKDIIINAWREVFVSLILGKKVLKKLKLEELGRASLEEYRQMNKVPVCVMLDNIRSMHNVGSAFRTADAFCIDKMFLTGITGKPPHREIHKTALGATESVEWEYHENAVELAKKLKAEGHLIIAIEQAEGSIPIDRFDLRNDQKYILVFGNEVFGVSDEIMELCDACLEIPQHGTKHSLNVAVSVGIALWEISRGYTKQ